MSHQKIIIKNTFAQVFSKVTTSLIGLITRKLLTNYLGPAGFGDYVFLLTYSTLFGSIADWGTITISVREASQHPKNQPHIFGSAIIGRLVLSAIACVLALAFSPLILKNTYSTSLVIASSALIIVMALKASFGIIFETLLQMTKYIYVDVVSSLSTLLLYALVISLQLPLISLFVSLITASLIACMVGLYLSLRLTPISFKLDKTNLKHLAVESFPMGLALIMFSIYNRVDTIILGSLRSAAEVGFYGLAYFIYENLVLLAAYVLNSVYPFLSHSALNSRSYFQKLFRQYYLAMMGLGFLALVGTFIFAPLLIMLLSSAQFSSSIPLLRILSISLLFSYLNHASGYSLIALGKQKIYSIITLSALVFNIILNLIYIPKFGATASAWITVGTEALVQILSVLLLFKILKLKTEK